MNTSLNESTKQLSIFNLQIVGEAYQNLKLKISRLLAIGSKGRINNFVINTYSSNRKLKENNKAKQIGTVLLKIEIIMVSY